MTCDEIRDLLPEYLFGSLDHDVSTRVRGHLRGCAGCRAEHARLEEGIVSLSLAAHDVAPPVDLRDRVMEVLADEWSDAHAPASIGGPTARQDPGWGRRLAAAAAVVAILVAALGWGLSERNRAVASVTDAESYRSILATLGGKEFRLGSLQADGAALRGQVVLYDGTGRWSSWGLVLVQGPSEVSDLTATLLAADGRTLVLPPLRFAGGEASSWVVTHEEISAFDRLTLTGPDGHVVATAEIHDA